MADSAELEARLAGKFGLPSEAETDPEAGAEETLGDPTPDVAEIDWEGGKVQVPAALKDAFMRNQDYTAKTSELAEIRRSLDHSRELMTRAQAESAFNASITPEINRLAVHDAYLEQISKLDWGKMPLEQMMRQRAEVDQIRDSRAAILKEIEDKRLKFQDETKQKISELRAKSRELAAKSIPNFNEETEKTIRDYAKSEGLSEAEIDSVLLDPRSAKVLWKASQFDKVRASTGKAVSQAGRALRPGTASERMPPETAARLNYLKGMKHAKTSADKAALVEQKLMSGSIFTRKQ